MCLVKNTLGIILIVSNITSINKISFERVTFKFFNNLLTGKMTLKNNAKFCVLLTILVVFFMINCHGLPLNITSRYNSNKTFVSELNKTGGILSTVSPTTSGPSNFSAFPSAISNTNSNQIIPSLRNKNSVEFWKIQHNLSDVINITKSIDAKVNRIAFNMVWLRIANICSAVIGASCIVPILVIMCRIKIQPSI